MYEDIENDAAEAVINAHARHQEYEDHINGLAHFLKDLELDRRGLELMLRQIYFRIERGVYGGREH